MSVFTGLQPENVWKHFAAICSIPHPSKHEEGIAQYIISEAKRLGFAYRRDEIGNVLVVKPATPGHESAPVLVLQGHMDMVPVAAPGVVHDFEKDPIIPYIDGHLVKAKGTTLGADNGIGGALMLALMEDTFAHGTLEFLFTVNEESGMDGAHNLHADFVAGRRLINLDTEEFGQYYVSCAGGGDSVVTLPVNRDVMAGAILLQISVGGLKGGHSGVDINLGRGSGNKIMARLLDAARQAAPFRLVAIKGGNKRNSISGNAQAVIALAPGDAELVRNAVSQHARVITAELEKTDPGLNVVVTDAGASELAPMSADSTHSVIDLLFALPHGVLAMSPEVPGLVETSTNVGIMSSTAEAFSCTSLTRSAVTSALDTVKRQIRIIAALANATVHEPKGYPGWKPNMDSEVLKLAMGVFDKIYGKQPEVKAIHAGLECGLFSEKLPGVDMLSIGPEMRNVHSPAEELDIPSVPKTYDLLKAIITALA